jgi:hypothetical protein
MLLLGYAVVLGGALQLLDMHPSLGAEGSAGPAGILRVYKSSITDKYGYLDDNGLIAIDPKFEAAWEFTDGLARVQIGGKVGYINSQGDVVIAPTFRKAEQFSEGLAAAWKGGTYGYIDKSGKFVIPARFDEGGDGGSTDGGVAIIFFSDGLAPFASKGKWGYIDKSGDIVIQPRFDAVGSFYEGFAVVQSISTDRTRLYHHIDGRGTYLQSAGRPYLGPFSEGLAVFCENEKLGYLSKDGTIAIPAQFAYASDFHEGRAVVFADIWAEVLGVEPSASYSPRRWCPGYGGLSKVSSYRSGCYSTRPRSLTSHRQFES